MLIDLRSLHIGAIRYERAKRDYLLKAVLCYNAGLFRERGVMLQYVGRWEFERFIKQCMEFKTAFYLNV